MNIYIYNNLIIQTFKDTLLIFSCSVIFSKQNKLFLFINKFKFKKYFDLIYVYVKEHTHYYQLKILKNYVIFFKHNLR